MDRHNEERPVRNAALAALATLTVVGCGGFVLVDRLDGQFAELARESRQRQASYRAFTERLDVVREDLAELRADVRDATAEDGEVRLELLARLDEAETQLGSIGHAVEAQASNLTRLEEVQASFAPELEAELAERDAALTRRWEMLDELARSANEAADMSQQRLEEIAAPRDLVRMWRELLGPVVQIAGEASVGSGVLLPSQTHVNGGYSTYLLTAWHVIRDIQDEPGSLDEPVSIAIYHEDGRVRREVARLLTFEPELDAALLIVHSVDDLGHGAELASRERLDGVRIFDEVYAVGCPLGNDPIPTRGEIATRSHDVEGETYWMINAPTYIGNSGGGIFDGQTHELVGIFSKIYTHGSLRPTIVPHMGLVTPLSSIYDWLAEEGFADVFEENERVADASKR